MRLIKRRGTLVVVSAPSGAGKTTLCHEVRMLVPDLYYSVSYTTRPPRAGETDGTDFYFVTEGAFTAMRARDEFAEWAEVHGHLSVSYTHLRAHETPEHLVCRLL